MHTHVCVCHKCVGTCGGQKRVSDALELVLQQLLGSKLRFSGRTVRALHCRAISPAPSCLTVNKYLTTTQNSTFFTCATVLRLHSRSDG